MMMLALVILLRDKRGDWFAFRSFVYIDPSSCMWLYVVHTGMPLKGT